MTSKSWYKGRQRNEIYVVIVLRYAVSWTWYKGRHWCTVKFLNQCEFVFTLIGWPFFEQSIAAAQGVGAKYRKFLEINKICPEVGIYKRKQENTLSTKKAIKKKKLKRKKTHSRPRKRSRKKEKTPFFSWSFSWSVSWSRACFLSLFS